MFFQISIAQVLGGQGHRDQTRWGATAAMIPLRERPGRWIDVACAYHQGDKPEECYRACSLSSAAPDE